MKCLLSFTVMVNSDGFMDYIVELINNMSHKTADQLRANPLVIAHCIGAMKILTAISITKESQVIEYFFSLFRNCEFSNPVVLVLKLR